jgi:hypothetical protein
MPLTPEARKKRYAELRDAGICTACANASPRPGATTCAPCAAEAADRRRRQEAVRKETGQCTDCGAGVYANSRYCGTCRKKRSVRQRERRRRDRAAWRAAGLCTLCGGARDTPHKMCSACSARQNQRSKTWHQKNRWAAREYLLRRKYGLTPDAFDALLRAQGGKCTICRSVLEMTSLHVDHCHDSGLVRGLLCRSCNVGLGHFRDDPLLLQRAARYLVIRGSTDERQAPLLNKEGA